MKKNGKEFNETAIKENTELKVDKLTLQRDLRQYRKQLGQAERDLEDYKQQLLEYADKARRRNASQEMIEELDALRQAVNDKDAHIKELQDQAGSTNDNSAAEVEKLKDEMRDLEADLRDRDRQLDEKDDELEKLKEDASGEDIDDLRNTLSERDDEINSLRAALQTAEADAARQRMDREQRVKQKDDEIAKLQEQMQIAGHDQSFAAKGKNEEIQRLKEEIQKLRKDIDDANEQMTEANRLKEESQSAQNLLGGELRKRSRAIEEKDYEIHTLQKKLDSADGRGQEAEKLQDEIHDLEAGVREKEDMIGDLEDQLVSRNDQTYINDKTNNCYRTILNKSCRVLRTNPTTNSSPHKTGYKSLNLRRPVTYKSFKNCEKAASGPLVPSQKHWKRPEPESRSLNLSSMRCATHSGHRKERLSVYETTLKIWRVICEKQGLNPRKTKMIGSLNDGLSNRQSPKQWIEPNLSNRQSRISKKRATHSPARNIIFVKLSITRRRDSRKSRVPCKHLLMIQIKWLSTMANVYV